MTGPDGKEFKTVENRVSRKKQTELAECRGK